ncbi:MAG: hypothetical protein ACRCZQ_02725 [Bacteroidales bacterium]
MKKKSLLSLFLALTMGLFLFNSCTSKDEAPQAEEMASLSFELDAGTIMPQTKAVGDSVKLPGYDLCVSPNVPMKVLVKLSGIATPLDLDVKLFGSVYKTDPYELEAKNYTVEYVTVYNPSNPSQVYYSGVMPGASFAPFIPAGYLMTQQQFTLLKYTKPTIKLYVLCAKGFKATDFGMPKFEINRLEVTCFDLFFNVCSETGEHFVGAGTIKVWSNVNDQPGAVLYSDTFNGGTIVNGNPTTAGDIATLCFANNLEIPDLNESYFVQIIFDAPYAGYNVLQKVTVADLIKFKQWKNWDPTMNAVHVTLCDPRANPKLFFIGYPEPTAPK